MSETYSDFVFVVQKVIKSLLLRIWVVLWYVLFVSLCSSRMGWAAGLWWLDGRRGVGFAQSRRIHFTQRE